MQEAVRSDGGAMAVIIGDVDIESVLSDTRAAIGGVCEAANDNGPGQIVISGNIAAVEKAMEISKDKGAKIAKKLEVSVPAHCSLMIPAIPGMREALDKTEWIAAPMMKFISNKTADVMDISDLKEALIYQLTHGVRWRESVLRLRDLGVEEIVEIGPGNVLTGLCKRIVPELKCYKLEI
jgi:[acyl-carrier-protein] S-malonyltransferase